MNQSNSKKIIIISVASIIAIALLLVVTYVILSRIAPVQRNRNAETNSISNKSEAEKVLKSATESDRLRDFDKATDQYNEILPFYKQSGETSVSDKNTAYQIEARINALKADKQALEKTLSDQASQNTNVRIVPEGQSNVQY